MIENSNNKSKRFDLEERTKKFAMKVRKFIKDLAKDQVYANDLNQLLRSSGSVGANYVEANEALSKKDFVMRVKICRKEIKECIYWLDLLNINENCQKSELIKEAFELMKIFGAIISKCQ